jgi:ATP-binding cassette subfamily C (CFTR/MRP) protein 10
VTLPSLVIAHSCSADVDRITNFCSSFHEFWSLPLQIILCLYLLWRQLGLSFLTGLACALLLIPVNRYLANEIGLASEIMMSHKDRRVGLMHELLYGIRTVKFLGWEAGFLRRIDAAREQEMAALRRRKYLDAWCVYWWVATPVLMSAATFACFLYVAGGALTPALVFTSLSIFNMLITPLNAFPWVVNGLVEALVSLRRLQTFLNQPDRAAWGQMASARTLVPPGQASLPADVVVRMARASFAWPGGMEETGSDKSENSPAASLGAAVLVLRDLTLDVRRGELLMVVGAVGAGKSSFFAAVGGELLLQAGSCVRRSDVLSLSPLLVFAVLFCLGVWPFRSFVFISFQRIGLVTQQAWLPSGTLRDIVLFGSAYVACCSLRTSTCLRPYPTVSSYEERAYRRVLHACALLPDLALMPAGDQTEIGEEGSTLSGGQRMRLTLARALYAQRNLGSR